MRATSLVFLSFLAQSVLSSLVPVRAASNPSCSNNGHFDVSSGSCVCNAGWATGVPAMGQRPSYCNVAVNATRDETPDSDGAGGGGGGGGGPTESQKNSSAPPLSRNSTGPSIPSHCSQEGTRVYNASSEICLCKEGWSTSVPMPPKRPVYCDVQDTTGGNDVAINESGEPLPSASTGPNSGGLSNVVEIILIILIIVGVLLCCCCCFNKKFAGQACDCCNGDDPRSPMNWGGKAEKPDPQAAAQQPQYVVMSPPPSQMPMPMPMSPSGVAMPPPIFVQSQDSGVFMSPQASFASHQGSFAAPYASPYVSPRGPQPVAPPFVPPRQAPSRFYYEM